jgi:ketosteroid isomerase-like protein
MRLQLPIMVVSGIALAIPAFAQQQNATEAVRQAIQDYIAQWQNRFNEHDSKDLATMYTSNAVRIFPDGRIIIGQQDIEKGLARGVNVVSNLLLKVEDVKAQGDVAWGYVHWTAMQKDEKDTPQPITGNSTNTWVRDAGSWKIAQEGIVQILLPPPK